MELLFNSPESKLFGLTIFISIVVFQIAYIFLQWYYIRRTDYLYYIAYMLGIVVYSISEFISILPFEFINSIEKDFTLYIRHSLPLICIFLYYRFSRYFVELADNRPRLNEWVKRLEYLILVYSIVSPLLLLAGVKLDTELAVFIGVSTFICICSIFIILSFLSQSNPLTRFAMLGAGLILTGSMLTLYYRLKTDSGDVLHFDPYLPLLICVIAELLTFTTGLSYKSRMIEFKNAEAERRFLIEAQEKQRLEIELLQVRNNIARDLHDEIGSGLTKISLLGEVIKKEGNISDDKIEKIITSANAMVGGLGDMVWSLNTNNDRLDNLVYFLRRYAVEYFEHTTIKLKIKTPAQVTNIELASVQRRSILMVVKEAFNNVVKHSHASELEMVIDVQERGLQILIHDNGIGLNGAIGAYSNGLKNMKERMGEIKGDIEINTESGTRILLTMPLSVFEYTPNG